jgi:valyl-tRNA synthetase
MNLPFADSYDPPAVEAAWYTWWEKQGMEACNINNPAYHQVLIIIVFIVPLLHKI